MMKMSILSGLAATCIFAGRAQAAVVYTYDVSDHNTASLTGTWTGSTTNVIQGSFSANHYIRQNAGGDHSTFLDNQALGLSSIDLTAYAVGAVVVSLNWEVRGGANFQQHAIGSGVNEAAGFGIGFFTRWNNQDNAGFVIGGTRVQQTTLEAALVGGDSWKDFTLNLIKVTDTTVGLALHIGDSETPHLTYTGDALNWAAISAYDGLGQRTVTQFVGLGELNIAVIPEPATALLGGLGLLGLLRRRRV